MHLPCTDQSEQVSMELSHTVFSLVHESALLCMYNICWMRQIESLPATVPQHPDMGLSHFAYSNEIIVGGSNFPEFSVFKKVFYSEIYALEDEKFIKIGDFPLKIA